MLAKTEFAVDESHWGIEFERMFSEHINETMLRTCQCSLMQADISTQTILNLAKQAIQYEKRKNQLFIRSILQKFTKFEVDRLTSNMAKNFGLSEKDFNLIVSQLKSNETAFFERVFLSHFSECVLYIQKNYSASYDDAYDATMETMIIFRERLVSNKIRYGNLRYLFTKMATQVFLKDVKAYRSRDVYETDLEEEVISVHPDDLNTLQKSWPELGEACQNLLKNYFYGKLKLTEIADIEGKSSATVRKQKERCLNRLKTLFTKHTMKG